MLTNFQKITEEVFVNEYSENMLALKAQAIKDCSGKGYDIQAILVKVNEMVNNLTNRSNRYHSREKFIEGRLQTYLREKSQMQRNNTPRVWMDELINNKLLVCRHKTILVQSILAELVKKNILPEGTVRVYPIAKDDQSGKGMGGHTWAVYIEKASNDLWICDPRWQYVGNTSNEMEKLIDRGYRKEVLEAMKSTYADVFSGHIPKPDEDEDLDSDSDSDSDSDNSYDEIDDEDVNNVEIPDRRRARNHVRFAIPEGEPVLVKRAGINPPQKQEPRDPLPKQMATPIAGLEAPQLHAQQPDIEFLSRPPITLYTEMEWRRSNVTRWMRDLGKSINGKGRYRDRILTEMTTFFQRLNENQAITNVEKAKVLYAYFNRVETDISGRRETNCFRSILRQMCHDYKDRLTETFGKDTGFSAVKLSIDMGEQLIIDIYNSRIDHEFGIGVHTDVRMQSAK